MTEEVTNQGESSHLGGEQGPPDPAPSTETDVQPTSFDAKALVTALQDSPEFLEMIDRSTQSQKDRRFNKIEGQLGNLEEGLSKYEEYRKSGKSPKEARREMQIDQMIAATTDEPQQQPGTQPVAPSSPELDKFFQEFDVDPRGADATQLIREGKTDSVSLTRFVLERDKRQSAPANPATIMPAGSGTTIEGESVDDLTARLKELQKQPTQHGEERREIMEKLAKLTPRK